MNITNRIFSQNNIHYARSLVLQYNLTASRQSPFYHLIGTVQGFSSQHRSTWSSNSSHPEDPRIKNWKHARLPTEFDRRPLPRPPIWKIISRLAVGGLEQTVQKPNAYYTFRYGPAPPPPPATKPKGDVALKPKIRRKTPTVRIILFSLFIEIFHSLYSLICLDSLPYIHTTGLCI